MTDHEDHVTIIFILCGLCILFTLPYNSIHCEFNYIHGRSYTAFTQFGSVISSGTVTKRSVNIDMYRISMV